VFEKNYPISNFMKISKCSGIVSHIQTNEAISVDFPE
jgi:hypothetical protein